MPEAPPRKPPVLFKERKPPLAPDEEMVSLTKEIAQLQKELAIVRVNTSICAKDLIQYTHDQRKNDFLITKECEPGTNIWQEASKGCCNLM